MRNLWEKCRDAVGKTVYFRGTNGNEYDTEHHGEPVEGVGYVREYHDSHGLCIIVELADGSVVCVDPIEVVVNKKHRSIDDAT
jgi:hypothetical protein